MKTLKQILSDVTINKVIGNLEQTMNSITFDSRAVTPGAVFVAVKGTLTDGHIFIGQAIANGATVIVCQELPQNLDETVTYIVVNNSAEATSVMVSNFFDNPSTKLRLIGVTGTNGKTTIATLLYQTFRKLGYKSGLLSTVANYIEDKQLPATHTTPDSVQLNRVMNEMVIAGIEYCFMEVSSHAIDQQRIAGLTFKGGIFTNLTHDHLDYHKTFDAYLKAKKSFFDSLPADAFALINADDKNGSVMVQNTSASVSYYSIKRLADFKGKILESHFDGMKLNLDGHEIWVQLIGLFNAYNLLAVYGSACLLNQPKMEVLRVLSELQTVNGRFQPIYSTDGKTAIIDYAHTPDALTNVLETINQIRKKEQNVITVVGAGGDRDKSKRPLMASVASENSTTLILTSDNPRSENPEQIIKDMQEGVKGKTNVISITDRREAIKAACMMSKSGDILLIAGKGHETYQEIKGVKHPFDDREIINEYFNMTN